VQPEWLQPPFSVTDLIAALLWVLAALYATLKVRDHEPGMGWFAMAMALLALFIGNNERHLPREPVWLPAVHGWFFVLLSGAGCLAAGLTSYVGLHGRARTLVLGAAVSPLLWCAVAAAGVDWLHWQVDRQAWSLVLTMSLVGLAGLAFWAERREPMAGHRYIGLAFLLVPATLIVVTASGSQSAQLRYWSLVPILVIGLTLLTVSLLRRRRMLLAEIARRAAAEDALARVNASLEAQVEARTRELHDVIAGLESFNRQVSHDLRGPLGGIGGLATLASQALQRGDMAAAQRLLTPIAQQAAVSAQLVDSLLMLARSGEVALNKRPLDLARMAREVADSLQPVTAAAPRVEIGALPVVQADEALLRAVLTNLIGNAVKFCAGRPNGAVRIDAERTAGEVTVMVADNGVGFEPGAAASLFQPFMRLHGAKFAGTGASV
jgi:signal transduction histidine kinase